MHGARVHRSLTRCSSARDERRPGLRGSARLTDGRRRKQVTGPEAAVIARLARTRSPRSRPRHPGVRPAERSDFPKYWRTLAVPAFRRAALASDHGRFRYARTPVRRARRGRPGFPERIQRRRRRNSSKGVNCFRVDICRVITPQQMPIVWPLIPLQGDRIARAVSRRRVKLRRSSTQERPNAADFVTHTRASAENGVGKQGSRRVYGMKNHANSISYSPFCP